MFLFFFTEFLDSTIVKGLDFAVNLVSAIGLLAGIPWALINKKKNKLAAKISNFLHYCVRLTALGLICIPLFFLMYMLYGVLFYYIFGGNNIDDNYTPLFLWILSITMAVILGLALIWIIGSFVLTSTWDYAINFLNLFLPPHIRLHKKLQQFEIISALYGVENKNIDVTEILQGLIINNKVEIIVSNRIFTDPALNQIKSLKVKYTYGNGDFFTEVAENAILKLPHEE